MTRSFNNYRLGACLFEEAPIAAPELSFASSAGLPERIDLRGFCAPVEDQGMIGSCAANAVVGAMEYHQRKNGEPEVDLSRLFLYYNARKLSDNEANDSGTYIHHAMAAVLAYGVCPEAMWPYQRAMWATKPVQACYDAALAFEAVSYARTPLGSACKAALVGGLPIVFGASINREMIQVEATLTGRVTAPTNGSWPEPGGGHAMLIVGYDDADGTWLIRNSWGADWGDGGYARIPYSVMEHYSDPSHFWVIGEIEHSAGFRVAGPSVAESHAALMGMGEAVGSGEPAGVDALGYHRGSVRAKLEHDLARAKAGFRERLRGPGAGGGY
ncbi:MAG: C1 family peptidase [bacterium]|nr:C1 family peptidase [bacterium]